MTMTMPKIFVPGGSPEDGRAAEAAGVDGVFVGDHVTFYGSGSAYFRVVSTREQRHVPRTLLYCFSRAYLSVSPRIGSPRSSRIWNVCIPWPRPDFRLQTSFLSGVTSIILVSSAPPAP